MITRIWLFMLFLLLLLVPAKINSLLSKNFDGELNLLNTHTRQKLQIRYLNQDGQVIPEAIQKISQFLRCPVTGKIHEIDLKLLQTLDQIQDHFGTSKTLEIISAYRSPELNSQLKAKGRHVATNSQHLFGKACDFKIDGVALSDIRDFAIQSKTGGVGYYPGLWVHLDSAGIRTW